MNYTMIDAGEYDDEVHVLYPSGMVAAVFAGCDRYCLAKAWMACH